MSEKSTKMVNNKTTNNLVDDQVKSTISADMESVGSNNLNNLNINTSTTSFNNSNINNSNLNNSNLNNITMNLNNHHHSSTQTTTDSEHLITTTTTTNISTTTNNTNIINQQHSVTNNLQSTNLTNDASSANENQFLSNQINQLNLTTTTLNIGNNLINGQNSIIQQSTNNLPPLNPIAASCPVPNNHINQTNIQQIPNSSMMNNVATNQSVPNIVSTNVELQDDSEDESEILEESPCGRWLKRREEVEQRDIPGIDATFLAMDTEEGVEVVWNEVRFSERKYFNSKEEKICDVFDRLILLNHPNIVKLHKYWIDKDAEKARIIFITEYMSSGSVKLFLKKTKKNEIKMSYIQWKRWCKQLLSALCYLHSSQPPIIHENLTCDTIFISHNGLIKCGAVAPNAIHQHIKTVADDQLSNIYLVAPEIMNLTGDISTVLTPAVDIYSFGMCALEMAALEISNGESSQITKETVEKTIESLDSESQKDFIRKCLAENPADRPTARELLFHPVIFEVPSLALLATHTILNNNPNYQLTDESFTKNFNNESDDTILAEIVHPDGRPGVVRRISDIPQREVEKMFEEVRNGAYPLTCFASAKQPIISRQTTISPEPSGSGNDQKSSLQESYNEENRKIINMMCNIKVPNAQENENLMMTLLLRLDDKMNRQLSCEILPDIESPICLANELVYYGFINQTDADMVAALINDTIKRTHYTKSDTSASVTLHQQATTTMPTTA